MNTTYSKHQAGRIMKPGMTFIATFMLLLALHPAQGAEVVITVTGILYDGYDRFHMFGVGTPLKGTDALDLTGQPFTLVFTFDDAKGQSTPPKGICASSGSGVTGEFASSPGTAVLTLGDKPYSFGIRKDSYSSAWRSIASWCSQSLISFEVHEGSGWSNGRNIVNVRMMPAKASGGKSLAQNPDWRASLSISDLDNNGGFFISRAGDFRHEARGNFDIKKVTISGPKASWWHGNSTVGR